jgi:hypothetical protein
MVGTVVAAILDALDLELPPLPAPGEPGFYSFSNGEVLEAAFAAAGFDEVDVEPFEIEYEYSSGGQLADWQFAISAPVNALLGQRPERRQEAWDAVAAAAEAYRASNGLIRFHQAPTGTPPLAIQADGIWQGALTCFVEGGVAGPHGRRHRWPRPTLTSPPVEPKALTTDTVKSSDAVITIGCGDIQHRHTTNAKPSKPVPVA